jgi:8-oxo-dGTP pyrophosphatase MutT (NUDIX family)
MLQKDRNKVIPAVFLILIKDNKILLLKRFNTGFQDGQYTLPAGHVDANECPTTALCREAKEEIDIDISPEDLIFEQVLYRRSFSTKGKEFDPNNLERVDFFFAAKNWKGTPHIMEPNKCDDLQWFELDSLPFNLFSIVKTFLSQYPRHKPFEESGY